MKYTIKRNHHFANFTINRLFPFVGKKIKGRVLFDGACLTEGEIAGWNKLTGITSSKIHENSGRLVWRSDGQKINIAAYVYENGVRNEKIIISTHPNIWTPFEIKYSNGYWVMSVLYKEVVLSGKMGFWKFRCYPYFGGQSTAPVTMQIEIR